MEADESRAESNERQADCREGGCSWGSMNREFKNSEQAKAKKEGKCHVRTQRKGGESSAACKKNGDKGVEVTSNLGVSGKPPARDLKEGISKKKGRPW